MKSTGVWHKGWVGYSRKQNKILAFTGPGPREGLWGFSRTNLSPVLKHFKSERGQE